VDFRATHRQAVVTIFRLRNSAGLESATSFTSSWAETRQYHHLNGISKDLAKTISRLTR